MNQTSRSAPAEIAFEASETDSGYRMASDHPDRVLSLAVMDIVPTYVMYTQVDRQLVTAYWHWYFMLQPCPHPENDIGAEPDTLHEGSLFGWRHASRR